MPTTLGKYQLGKTLGSGISCKVKLSRDNNTGKRYALKILKPMTDPHKNFLKNLIDTEVEVLKKLNHRHIINLVEVGHDILVSTHKTKEAAEYDYIVLELAAGGELFDFVANSGAFSERVARTFFL